MYMHRNRHFFARVAALALLFVAPWLPAQTSRPAPSAPTTTYTTISEADLDSTRDKLFNILRLSPKLTAVLSRDPSLLSDQEYVTRNNPQLAVFLQQHPDIARNPEFYLFADQSRPGKRLEQYVFPELGYHQAAWERYMGEIMGFLVFLVILCALLWLLRVLLENRRWSRVLKLQTEVHGKLLDKFGSNQELLTYMNTEAGKRFLEAAPMPAAPELGAPAKMSLARILLPLQLGVVVFLLGAACFSLRGIPGADAPFRILGILGLMLGVGFIISAGLAFFLARHLDLLPKKVDQLATKEQL